MLIEYKDLSSVRKQVEVEIPAERISSKLGEVTEEFSRHVKLPGFRPGKAPKAMVRTRFAKDIQDEVLDRLLPEFFHDAIREKSVEPLSDPVLRDVGTLLEGQPLKFVAEFEIKPEFDLADYSGLEVTVPVVEVTPAEVDDVIENLRMRSATFRPVEDRGAERGDWVSVDIEATGEGVETRKTEGYEFELGDGAPLPEIVDALMGKKSGDHVEFEKAWDDEAPNEEVRGKTMTYAVDLRELRILEKPEVDDAFASGLGWSTAPEMREAIDADLRRHKEHDVESSKRRQIGDKLNELHELEVPESLVEDELVRALRNYASYLAQRGVDVERAELDWEKMREDFRPESVERAKRGLILEAIADKENLDVGNAEIDAQIRRMASNDDFAETKARLRRDGGYDKIRRALRVDKALEHVLGLAEVKTESAEKASR